MTATRMGSFFPTVSSASASSSRPDAVELGSLVERKTVLNGRTSLAGSPFARAAGTASTAATAAAQRGARRRFTRASCAVSADRVAQEQDHDHDGGRGRSECDEAGGEREQLAAAT